MKRLHAVWFIAVLLLVAATGSVAVARTTHRASRLTVRTTRRGGHVHTTSTTLAETTTTPTTTTPPTTTPPTTAQPPETTPTTASPPPTTTPTTVAPGCVGTPMLLGQVDIDAQPAGTRFCLSGTHNWTLTPKSGDTLSGPAVLDGANTSDFAVVATATNVTLSGLEIRNYIAGAAIGAIHTPDPPSATGWTLDNLQVHDIGNGTTDGAGAELGVGWHVVGGRYFNTRQEGLTAGDGAANFVVDGVELDHNDFTDDTYTTRSHSCGDEAGGFKLVADNVTIKNSYVHDNACSGLWSDLSSNNLTITNNLLVNNWEQGVVLEISGAATISHNVVTGNGFHMQNANNHGCGWGWGGGITLSTSGQTHTSNGPIDIGFNDVAGNCNGITGVDQLRTEHNCNIAPRCELAHIRIHDNTIVGATAANAVNNLGFFQDDGDDLTTRDIIFGTGNTVTNMNNCQFTC
jgi:parallel beta-helix repeat protein